MQNDQARNHVMIRSAFAVASASIAVSIQVGHSRESHLVTLWALLFVSCGTTITQSVAVFDFELIDTSLEGAIRGARPGEQERLPRLSDQLRQLLGASGRLSLVDITPIPREAQASNLQACAGCDMRLAQRIGAKLAITGTVQKVSNLILNMNIYVRDASSGATIAAMSADMRAIPTSRVNNITPGAA